MKRDTFLRIGALGFVILTLAFRFLDPVLSDDPLTQTLLTETLTRILGSAVFIFVLLYLDRPVLHRFRPNNLAVLIPAFAVALNNLPWIALCRGNAAVDRTDLIPLFALECLFIGVFEELIFRGILFPILLDRYGKRKHGVFLTAFCSSALFGLVHLLNLLQGAGFGATILQVGYSFLIGGMCAIVFLRTKNLLWCILIHATYDFCGELIPMLGHGTLWDAPTVILTALLGTAVFAIMIRELLRP